MTTAITAPSPSLLRSPTNDGTQGFHTAGNSACFFLIGLLAALIFPYFSRAVNRGGEKKIVMETVTAISKLKQQAISYMKVGEIDMEGNHLVFYLDNKEIERLYLPELKGFSNAVFFNRNGLTGGGEIVLKFSRPYKIVIREVTGHIHVE
jgi:hypothetical protein